VKLTERSKGEEWMKLIVLDGHGAKNRPRYIFKTDECQWAEGNSKYLLKGKGVSLVCTGGEDLGVTWRKKIR